MPPLFNEGAVRPLPTSPDPRSRTASAPRTRDSRARVLMLCHSYFEDDSRIRREAAALLEGGYDVDVVALRRPGMAATSVLNGVNVRRVSVQHVQGRSAAGYVGEYGSFFMRAAIEAARLHRHRHYRLVEVHTLPDFLVFAALPLKMLGVATMIDLHEAMPPFFRTRFHALDRPGMVRGLEMIERASIAAVDAAITVNDSLRDRLVDLGVPPEKVTVVLNSPDIRLFDASKHPKRPFTEDGVLRLIYAGSLTPLYDVESVIRALGLLASGADGGDPLRDRIALDIYGSGDTEVHLRAVTADLGLQESIRFRGRVPVETVASKIAAADVGVAPTRPDRYTQLSMSTKLFEYGAMGKPVLASRLMTVERYFGEDTLAYFDPGEPASAAAALRRLMTDRSWRERLVSGTADRIRQLSWEGEANKYRAVVGRVVTAGRRRA